MGAKLKLRLLILEKISAQSFFTCSRCSTHNFRKSDLLRSFPAFWDDDMIQWVIMEGEEGGSCGVVSRHGKLVKEAETFHPQLLHNFSGWEETGCGMGGGELEDEDFVAIESFKCFSSCFSNFILSFVSSLRSFFHNFTSDLSALPIAALSFSALILFSRSSAFNLSATLTGAECFRA